MFNSTFFQFIEQMYGKKLDFDYNQEFLLTNFLSKISETRSRI
jgi:hypothetical protein